MWPYLLSLIDRLIHPSVKLDIQTHLRIRGLVSLGLAYTLTFLLATAISGKPTMAHAAILASIVIGFWFAKVTGRHEQVAVAMIISLSLGIFYFLINHSFLDNLVIYWMPVIIVGALYTCHAFWGSIVSGFLFGGFTAIFFWRILPEAETPVEAQRFMRLFGHLILVNVMAYAMSFIYEQTNQNIIRISSRRQAELELQKQKTIEAAKLSSLGEMAGGIAHEINNPLTIIRGNAEMLRMDPDVTEKTLQRSQRIIATVDRIEKIISAMRNLSRQEPGDLFKAVDLSEVINEVMVFFREKMHSLSMHLELELEQGCITHGNHIQIGQVLINLMNNAIDALLENKPEFPWIKINMHAKNIRLEIVVSNNGPKIPKDLQEKIMRPFFTTKEIGKGTGLGLSVSQQIIKHHGGELVFDSSAPYTSFVIYLPKAHPLSQLESA